MMRFPFITLLLIQFTLIGAETGIRGAEDGLHVEGPGLLVKNQLSVGSVAKFHKLDGTPTICVAEEEGSLHFAADSQVYFCDGTEWSVLPTAGTASNQGRSTVRGDSVRGVSTFFVDSSSGDVTIEGFQGGVKGQNLQVVKTSYENKVSIVHGDVGGDVQPIILPTTLDRNSISFTNLPLTLTGYASVSAVYSGDAWHFQGPNPGGLCRNQVAVFRNLVFKQESQGILTVSHLRDSLCGQVIPVNSYLVTDLKVKERLGGAYVCHLNGVSLKASTSGFRDFYCTSDFSKPAGVDNKPTFLDTPGKYDGLSFEYEQATDKLYVRRAALSESAPYEWDINIFGTVFVHSNDRDDTSACLGSTMYPCP